MPPTTNGLGPSSKQRQILVGGAIGAKNHIGATMIEPQTLLILQSFRSSGMTGGDSPCVSYLLMTIKTMCLGARSPVVYNKNLLTVWQPTTMQPLIATWCSKMKLVTTLPIVAATPASTLNTAFLIGGQACKFWSSTSVSQLSLKMSSYLAAP